MKKEFILENLHCANCAAKIEEKLNNLNEVSSATIIFSTKKLMIEGTNFIEKKDKIEEICNSVEDGIVVLEQKKEKKKGITLKDKINIITIILGTIVFVSIEILHEVLGVEEYTWYMVVFFVVSYLLLGGNILKKAGKNITKGIVFDENFLMSIATLGAFVIKLYPEAVGVMLFFRIGEMFEHFAVERSKSQIMDAVNLMPEEVHLVENEEIIVCAIEHVKIGDVILIRPGDRIPLDGLIIKGESVVDTSAITGESIPISIMEGTEVLSGSMNVSGAVYLKVQKELKESMVTKILESVEHAAASKPIIDKFITRFARIYTPIVVFLAVFTAFIIPTVLGQPYYSWIYTALTFLVMSCPCALVLSVPLAYFCGIGSASKMGVLFKGGIIIESLSKIKAVVMDKTGTITKGEFRVQSIFTFQEYEEKEVLTFCASLERISTHPIANSVVSYAKELQCELLQVEELQEYAGNGVKGCVLGKEVICGNLELLKKEKIRIENRKEIEEIDAKEATKVYVVIEQKIVAIILIADTIKPEAKKTIQEMRQLGLFTVMLTGDSKATAKSVAENTGIELHYGALLPHEKLEHLQEIRNKKGSVLFVGDGINDAPVLAGADVGAAMGSGADAAIEAADVVFMNSNLDAVTKAIKVAKTTTSIAFQNVVFSLVIKISVMLLGLFGIYSNMWLAVFADTGVAFLCILNSIRILKIKVDR
ncbi:MAG: heavy metal translocating P-type ATPase [Lachnospiraceae bacterium]